MKKTFLAISCLAIVLISCTKTDIQSDVTADGIKAPSGESITARTCASQDVLERQLLEDPSLRQRMNAIEEATTRFAANPSSYRLVNGIIQIPVVVNVLYNTTAQNVSLAQIQTQIDVLNKDYSGTNSDITNVPSNFTAVKAGDVGVRFVLDQVIRLSTKKTSWRTDDAMKKSSRGGINPTSPDTKLNFWVCNMSGGILGYAQFPGGSSATDGVVIHTPAFGVTTNYAPYNEGRTATHEVGHWLNLRHIWGDAQCGNDFVGDTPLHTGANYGCPLKDTRSSCTGTPIMMTMNYMDYTDDPCMYMFSAGQKTRMNATFISGGGRAGFALP